jgi:hypothetical protein
MPTDIASNFERKERAQGESYITLKDDHPEWLKDAVHEAHHDTLPNDWIYEECHAAVEAFDTGCLLDEDAVHQYVDGRVDTYTRDLYQWAADFCLTDTWAEAEADAKEMGLPEETEKRIACIQYAAIRHIAETMRAACEGAVKVTP